MAEACVLTEARLATMLAGGAPYGLVEKAALAIGDDGRIAWLGPARDLPETFRAWRQERLEDRLVTPALIDCHTHLVFAGDRAGEFERRLRGATYAEIAAQGGGIAATVAATRRASEDELVASALPRLDHLLAEGVATVEIKSGYGLDIAAELKMLRAARRLAQARPVRVVTSYLAAHALPGEYRDRRAAYMEEVALPGLDAAHAAGLADAVDAFCEGIAFLPAEIAPLFARARALGLPVRLHAGQLSDRGGAQLAAAHGALSADHLEHLDAAGAAALARAGSVAVLLPGAFYSLRETKAPPVGLLRAHRVAMAVATDCNPGTSPLTSPLLALNMASTLFRLTPEEALAGMTREAARALGHLAEIGTLEAGKRADLAVWSVERPAELAYRMGFNPLHARYFGGAMQ